jgi:hypothetical protein
MTMLSPATLLTVTASGRRRALPGAARLCPSFENCPEQISKKIIGAQRRIF